MKCLAAVFVFVIFTANLALARTCHLEIEYSYTPKANIGKTVRGFRLYKNGAKVCQVNRANARSFSCTFESDPGRYNFRLAPYFDNGSVGPYSAIYPVTIKEKTTAGTTPGGNNNTNTVPVVLWETKTPGNNPEKYHYRRLVALQWVIQTMVLDIEEENKK